jgi:hypothetical protein
MLLGLPTLSGPGPGPCPSPAPYPTPPNPLPILIASPFSPPTNPSLYQSLRPSSRYQTPRRHSTYPHGRSHIHIPMPFTRTPTSPCPPTTYTLSLPIHTASLNSVGYGLYLLLDHAFMIKLFLRLSTTFCTAFFKVPTNSFTIKASSNNEHYIHLISNHLLLIPQSLSCLSVV